jgi:hypothetical protein
VRGKPSDAVRGGLALEGWLAGLYGARMKYKLLAAAVCSAILLAVPWSASAARPATVEEKAAVSAIYAAPPDCSKVVVSERRSRYARWDFVPSDSCEPTGNGFGIARRDDSGQWRDFYQASDSSDACPTTPLPTTVGVELRACTRPSRHIYITNFLSQRALIEPRQLPHGAHSFLGPLRWRGWDRPVARARGVLVYSDRTATLKAPIRLRAFRVRFCGAKRIYTRLALTFVRTADSRRYPHFVETRRSGCPSRG